MPQGALLVDVASGHILGANTAAATYLGYSREVLLSRLWRELQCSGASLNIADGMMMAQHYRRADGSERVLDTAFSLLPPSKKSEAPKLLVMLTPCEERLRMEQEHREFLKAVEEEKKLRALGQLAGGIAHDFNNLLAIIAGNLDMMLREGVNLESLEECRATVERARGLSKQILRFAKRESPKKEHVLLDEVAHRVGALVGVETTVVIDGKPLCLLTDPAELESALVNLITNAKDAVEKEGVVKIKVERLLLTDKTRYFRGELSPGEYLALTISDNGPGIPAQLHERLFEPYFTTKTHKGIGLGLARVGAYVELMKGAIDLQTNPAVGTSWKLILPAQECPCPSKDLCVQKENERKLHAPIFSGKKEKRTEVIVVDDEPALVRLVGKLLSREGYRSLGFTQPQDAYENLAAREVPFVLVTDAKMPGLSGVGLVKALRSAHRRFSALLMSGYTEELTSATSDLFEARLEKPISANSLMNAIRNASRRL